MENELKMLQQIANNYIFVNKKMYRNFIVYSLLHIAQNRVNELSIGLTLWMNELSSS